MAQKVIPNDYAEKTTIVDDDLIMVSDSQDGNKLKRAKKENIVKSVQDFALVSPDFYKYSIVTSVNSGDLIVALKNYLGQDPSVSAPVKVQIGGVVYTITSALTGGLMSAGVNYFNAGSSELATKEIDYFTYIGRKTSTGVFYIGIARRPDFIKKGDFSETTSSENALTWLDNLDSGDYVVNIGRFNAILSAGAGYTWSIPGNSVILNYPVYESRVLDMNMSSTGAIVSSWDYAKYKISGNTVYMEVRADGKSISGSGPIQHKLPFLMLNGGMGHTVQINNGTQWLIPLSGGNEIFKTQNAGSWNGSETGVNIRFNKTYIIA